MLVDKLVGERLTQSKIRLQKVFSRYLDIIRNSCSSVVSVGTVAKTVLETARCDHPCNHPCDHPYDDLGTVSWGGWENKLHGYQVAGAVKGHASTMHTPELQFHSQVFVQ
jgi:hypothetical protein